jgi:peptidoglycan-N-acetylglucosamine deacetylase
VNRRVFLRRSGLAAGAGLVGMSGTAGGEEYRIRENVSLAGHAVGRYRPPGLTATTLTYRVPTTKPVVALTFDDGPSTAYTRRVLDILERKDVVATFYVIGRHVRSLPGLARDVAARHDVGNHTWSHPNMSLARAPRARTELARGADVIAQAIGRQPTSHRPPFGYFSGATAMIAAGMGYPIVLWDVAFNRHREDAAANIERMTQQIGPGSIILGHDGGTLTCDVVVQALPKLIDRLRDKGLDFVTVPDLLNAAPRTESRA